MFASKIKIYYLYSNLNNAIHLSIRDKKLFLLDFTPKESYHLFRARNIYDITPIDYAKERSKSLKKLKTIGALEQIHKFIRHTNVIQPFVTLIF